MKTYDLNQVVLAQCSTVPVIPVITVKDIATAAPLAQALVAGGVPILEITLRTDCALAAMAQMVQVKGAIIGAGTIRNQKDIENTKAAGATFAVSPGVTGAILGAAEQAQMPLLAGAATASEMMHLADQGVLFQKFFPAEAAGGAAALKSFAAPLADIKFCPTGGVNVKNASDYLRLPNTVCVGGSWVCPDDLIAAGEWDAITDLAQQAVTALKA